MRWAVLIVSREVFGDFSHELICSQAHLKEKPDTRIPVGTSYRSNAWLQKISPDIGRLRVAFFAGKTALGDFRYVGSENERLLTRHIRKEH